MTERNPSMPKTVTSNGKFSLNCNRAAIALTGSVTLIRWLCLIFPLLFVPQNAKAQFAGGPDDVQVIYALYVSGDSFVDVTDRVTKLFQGDNFFAHSDTLNASPQAKDGNSLL